VQTIYLLRKARRRGHDDGYVIASFTTIELAKEYLEVEYLPTFKQRVEWVACNHSGMWDCVESTFDKDCGNLVTYIEDGEVADSGYVITCESLIDHSRSESVQKSLPNVEFDNYYIGQVVEATVIDYNYYREVMGVETNRCREIHVPFDVTKPEPFPLGHTVTVKIVGSGKDSYDAELVKDFYRQ